MRAFKFLNLVILSALVATSAALYAQDDKPQEDKPRQENPKRAEEPKRQDEAKPSKPDSKQDKNEQRQDEKQSRDEMKTDRQEPVPQGHARPSGKSVRIPDEKFHAQFGRSHTFHAQRPVAVNGQPRFEYGGYSLALVDASPV